MHHRIGLADAVEWNGDKVAQSMISKLQTRMLAGLDDDGWLALRRQGAGNGAQLDCFGTRTNDKRNFLRVQYSP